MDLDLKRMKEILLDALIEIDRICEANDIRYYLLGGTMLGAVRHQGFIPWDDDIDIGMPRDDYNRFIEICKSQLEKVYEIQQYNTLDYHPYNYLKLIDKRTLLIQQSLKHLNAESGVFVDIFPLDGVPSNKFVRAIHMLHIKFYRVYIYNYYYSSEGIKQAYSDRGIKKNILLMRMKIIKGVSNFINIKNIHKKLDKLLSKYKYDDSDIIGNYLGAWGEKEIMYKKYFGEGKKVMFEKKEFTGVENTDAYLKRLYGDYWKLPPIEMRKSHHKFTKIKLPDE